MRYVDSKWNIIILPMSDITIMCVKIRTEEMVVVTEIINIFLKKTRLIHAAAIFKLLFQIIF